MKSAGDENPVRDKQSVSNEPQRYLRVSHFARECDLSTATVYKLLRQGLPHINIGGMIRVPVDALEMLAAKETAELSKAAEP